VQENCELVAVPDGHLVGPEVCDLRGPSLCPIELGTWSRSSSCREQKQADKEFWNDRIQAVKKRAREIMTRNVADARIVKGGLRTWMGRERGCWW
jgi:hypothetical protein